MKNLLKEKTQLIDKIEIVDQYWYQEIRKRWHEKDYFNREGDHVTILKIGRAKVKEVFCVRNHDATCTVKFTNGSYFNYRIIRNSLYLNATFEVLAKGYVRIKVPLSWYCLSYFYDLVGKERKKICV